MKKLVLVFAFGFFSLGSLFAASTPDLDNEMTEKVTIDLSDIQLDKYVKDYVLVSFKIVNGEIKINAIEGSQVALTKAIVKKMAQMRIESEYDANATYQYKFSFEKI